MPLLKPHTARQRARAAIAMAVVGLMPTGCLVHIAAVAVPIVRLMMYSTMVLTCLNDEDYDHEKGEANQERQRNASQVKAVLAPQHQCSYTQKEDGRGYESQNGRHKP